MLKKLFFSFLKSFCKRNVNPKPDGKISLNEISKVLNKAGIKKDQIKISDNNYLICRHKDIKAFLEENKIDKRKYIPVKHDCDNFSFSLMGKASFLLSGYIFGIIWVKKENSLHALNFFIDSDLKLWYIEPQTDKIFQSNKIKPYFAIC